MKPVLPALLRKWIAPRSLQSQLLSRSLFILSALLVLIGTLQYFFMSHFLYQSTAQNIRSQVQSMPFQVWVNGSPGMGGDSFANPKPFGFAMRDSTVSFIDQSGNYRVVFSAPNANPAPRFANSVYLSAMTYGQHRGQYQIVKADNGKSNLVVMVPVGPPGRPIGVVQVSMGVGSLQRLLTQQLVIFIFLGLAALIAGFFTFLSTLRRTLVPLSQMSASVKRVNAGNMDERIVLKNPQSEIEVLASSFNSMLERLSSSFKAERRSKEKMRQFVADASHELRTPLTSIRGFVEVLLRGAAVQPDQLQKSLSSMLSETERLSKLVQDMLTLARLDEERPLDLREDRLDLVLKDMEPQLQVLAGKRTVSLMAKDEVTLMFDRDRIKQVVLNLFQNAVSHTDAIDGEIVISLEAQMGERQAEELQTADPQAAKLGVWLIVRDNGPGIPSEHLQQLFERFYRVDTARSRKDGGAGIGLAITKSIVDYHGGTIRCESELGQGTSFIIWLPIGKPV